jgi:hypothetical protein
MLREDATLQELIVRALTGMDERARQKLDAARATDPELKQFCAELDDVVNVLMKSKDWGSVKPSPELTAKIRSAVAAKLPSAPPHFKTVVLQSELGQGSSAIGIVLWVVAVAILIGTVGYFVSQRSGSESALKLTGAGFETPLKADLKNWEKLGEGSWEIAGEFLAVKGGEEPCALYLKEGFEAGGAMAFEIDVKVPGLDERSNVVVFIAEAVNVPQPPFNTSVRPNQALTLEISRESLVLSGPDQTLLQSKQVSHAEPKFYRVRLEHLGGRVRVLLNGQSFFDGAVMRSLRGKLHPGVRVAGPQKGEVRFNTARVER